MLASEEEQVLERRDWIKKTEFIDWKETRSKI
jgi:hypothetical protein